MKRVYLDNAATTPLLPSVQQAMSDVIGVFGNASSMHTEGRQARQAIENARSHIAKLIGALPDEIIFTSGGSESNNMLIDSFSDQKIAVSAIEHPSILEPAKLNPNLKIIPVDKSGKVNFEAYRKILADKPALVSVMLANNEIGTIQDIRSLAELAHNSGCLVHTDATQAVGKIPVNVNDLGVDYLTMSAHKIGGPKGVGTLYIRTGSPVRGLILGGHQEKTLRAGTYNTLGIIGFGEAAKYALETPSLFKRVRPYCQKLRDEIVKNIPGSVVNGDQADTLPHILNVSFKGAEGESILLALDDAGIAISTGSACASDDITPSHVLMAINADPELAHGSIRFSLGLDTTDQDIDYVLKVLPPVIAKLRSFSTAYNERTKK